MKKKITKLIESAIPQLIYDKYEEIIDRRKVANKIYDAIPNPERLDLEPFQRWIPPQCASCVKYNDANKLGCTYELFSETFHTENPPPDDCPNGYSA